jgi:Flp pilus assembly protein TadG
MRRRQRGSALIEFAISGSLLFAIFAGTFEIGYTLYSYNTLLNAVREGARYASMRPYDAPVTGTPGVAFAAAVRNIVVYGNPNPGRADAPVMRGLKTDDVTVAVATGPGGTVAPPVSVTVSIQGYEIDVLVKRISLEGRPSVTFLYTGVVTR